MKGAEKLRTLREQARIAGGEERIKRHRDRGRITARDRIEMLLDPTSFVEMGTFAAGPSGVYTDGVVTGWGRIDGQLVYLYSQDFTVAGGSLGERHGQKIARLMDLAHQNGAPLIGLNDSGGARIQEGVHSLAVCGEIFQRNTRSSGIIPQLSVILGPCAGAAAYSPALTDFVFMLKENAYMFITGPEVVRAVTGEEVSFAALGGAAVHEAASGVAHFTAPDEAELLIRLRWLLSYLPANNLAEPPFVEPTDGRQRPTPELEEIVPDDAQKPYDIREVIGVVMDNGEFLEVHEAYAPNLVVGFARLNGHVVGIVANQPAYLAGVLDINASDKGARFIRFCDAFHIPLITLVDTPGFMPGVEQESGGIIRHGAKMIFAYAEATVPKISLILRKAYGGAYIVMSSKHLQGDLNFAWPDAEIAVMGPEGAVNILHRKELAAAENPDELRQKRTAEYREELAHPYIAAERGYLDSIILPIETRHILIDALESLREKRQPTAARKHGIMPV